jgi:hypothetical protein
MMNLTHSTLTLAVIPVSAVCLSIIKKACNDVCFAENSEICDDGFWKINRKTLFFSSKLKKSEKLSLTRYNNTFNCN